MEQVVPVKKFSDLNIKIERKSITGDKVKIEDVIGKEIVIHSYAIEDSKIDRFKESGDSKCLYLQFKMNDKDCLVFTRAKGLMEAMEKVGMANLPIMATIVKDEQRRLLFK